MCCRTAACLCSRAWTNLFNTGLFWSFSEVLADPQREVLLERNTILPETDCKGCRYWDICHGGCPLDAWSGSGSFLHKSEWCYAKRGFIEKYFEPTVNPGAPVGATSAHEPHPPLPPSPPVNLARIGKRQRAKDPEASPELPWINPIGGLGDTLMISGVLKHVVEQDPSRKFNLVIRTKYRPILEDPLSRIGHPPPGSGWLFYHNYWEHEDYRRPGKGPTRCWPGSSA
jgi:radical SAM protein with 4Fe4S-binding SPASM domain